MQQPAAPLWEPEDGKYVRACPLHLCDLLITADARLWCPAGHELRGWVLIDDDTDTLVARVYRAGLAIELLGAQPVERRVPSPYVVPPMTTCSNAVCGRPILERKGRRYCDHNCHPTSRAPRRTPRRYRASRHDHNWSGARLPAYRMAS